MAQWAAAALKQAGYLISPKRKLEPTKLITWMGKRINLSSARIEPSTPFVADVVSKLLLLALKPYHYKSLWRLLSKIVWLGRPAASVFMAQSRPVLVSPNPFCCCPLPVGGHCCLFPR